MFVGKVRAEFWSVALAIFGPVGHLAMAQLPEPQPAITSSRDAVHHFQTGLQALQIGETDRALVELGRAVRLVPDNSNYWAALSAAYLDKENLNAAWKSARRAVQLDSRDSAAVEQLAMVWSALGAQDAFRVGTSNNNIESRIGKPDRVNRRDDNERWFYGCFAIDFAGSALFSTIDLRGFAGGLPESPVKIGFEPDPDQWRVRYRTIDRSVSVTEYAPVSEPDASKDGDVTVRQPRIQVQRMHGLAGQRVSPRDWLERHYRVGFPATDRWEVIHEDEYGLVFEHHGSAREEEPESWEIARVLRGPLDLYMVGYVSPTRPVDSLIAEWRERLRIMRLVQLRAASTSGEGNTP